MSALNFNMNVVLVLFVGSVLAFADAFEMKITHHAPWWSLESNANGLETSYQYYYPHNHQRQFPRQFHKKDTTRWNYPSYHNEYKKDNFRWKSQARQQDRKKDNSRWNYKDNSRWNYPTTDYSKVKMPPMPAVPKPKYGGREWPDYIPPVRMIKLPLDEPPAF